MSALRIAVVGRGRVGPSIASALTRSGVAVTGPLGRGATGAGSDVVLLAVPDRSIAEAAMLIERGPVVGHVSASTPLEALAPHERFLLHPLQAVTAADTDLRGSFAAVAGSSGRARRIARELAELLGLRAVEIDEADRPLYHAAASLAANALVALLWDAERAATTAGLPREALAPLAAGALAAWSEHGAGDALTGPVARGDEETVARQRAAIAARHPELLPLWDALTERLRALAADRPR